MDSGSGISLCQPSLAILLISVAGVLYHLFMGAGRGIMWWLAVGVVGTATFQALCFGGLEPLAWILMMIPVLLVCFFLAVALFSSSVRIKNVEKVPCGRCGGPPPCGCDGGRSSSPPPCDCRYPGCPYCPQSDGNGSGGDDSCSFCRGGGCRMCGGGGGGTGGYLEQV
jgi:hypothetical protein